MKQSLRKVPTPKPLERLRIAQVVDRMDGEIMLQALQQIREMGYSSNAARATDTVLACIRVAEEAIGEVEDKAFCKVCNGAGFVKGEI